MINRKITAKLDSLDDRMAQLVAKQLAQELALTRELATLNHKLSEQSRAMQRLLQYAAESTGPESVADTDDAVTWSD